MKKLLSNSFGVFFLALTIYGASFGVPHAFKMHSLWDGVAAFFLPPWGWYRAFEMWWHVDTVDIQQKKKATSLQGEFVPHFTGNNFRYAGELQNNFIYLHKNESGNFASNFNDSTFSTGVRIAREQIVIIAHKPNSNSFASINLAEVQNSEMRPEDIEFRVTDSSGLAQKAWRRLKTPSMFKNEHIKGQTQGWFKFDTYYKGDEIEISYVGDKLFNFKNNFEFSPLLTVTVNNYEFTIDKKNHTFSAVMCDLFWAPVQESKKGKITSGSAAELIMNKINEIK